MTKRVILHGVSDEDAREIKWNDKVGNAIFFHGWGDDGWTFSDITIEDEPEQQEVPWPSAD